MRVFNYASQPSWMSLLAAALLGTSTVQAIELDLEDGGRYPSVTFLWAATNSNQKILLRRQPNLSPAT